ncbi:MAG: hypothetical protein ABSF95_00580 [Verrucomicrobiota bacterium]|jgi:hypothetical protein
MPDSNPHLSALRQAAVAETDDFDYKDLYFPLPGSEQAVLPRATTAFQAAGYEIRQGEKAPYHPVYIFKLKRLTAPRFVSQRELQDHVREILSGVGLAVPKDPPLAHQTGDRILVTFIWHDARQEGNTRRTRRVPMGG